jgi:hypothetical protein
MQVQQAVIITTKKGKGEVVKTKIVDHFMCQIDETKSKMANAQQYTIILMKSLLVHSQIISTKPNGDTDWYHQ